MQPPDHEPRPQVIGRHYRPPRPALPTRHSRLPQTLRDPKATVSRHGQQNPQIQDPLGGRFVIKYSDNSVWHTWDARSGCDRFAP